MNNSTKNILLGVLVVGLIGMTVAYAALSTTLRISGTASVPNVTWDIHLASFAKQANTASLVTGQTNTADGNVPTITNGTAINGLAVTFNQPGDKVVYTFNIVNGGSIDAKLASFSESLTRASGAAMDQATINSRFTHTIVCNPTQETYTGTADYLNKSGSEHSSASCTLTLAWNEANLNAGGQTSQTAGEDQTFTQGAITLNYSAQWQYVQK